MDERWESVYGRIERRPKYTKFVVWVTLKNGLVVHRAIAVPNEQLRAARVDLYAFTLNTIVRELDEHLSARP